ncbi:MAG TPA: MgtC/SapB family protein, partial [Geobacterales bacterium]|nr:MgtC/SapB family protein [Geobacterales bacterium]
LKFYFLYGNVSGSGPIGVDPARIAAQVVTGIGFLGAGAIIREGTSVRGLTTAACLWVVAAIGVAAAAGLYLISSVVTVIALVSLLVLKRVETMISRDVYTSSKIWSDDIAGQMARIEEIISSCRMSVMNVSMERDMQKGEIFLTYEVRFNDRLKPCSVMDSIFTASGVRRVRLD